MLVVLATLRSEFVLSPIPDLLLDAEALATLRPRGGLEMVVTPMSPKPAARHRVSA